ncbi:HNH endonuclease signature motif containing protein [Saccharothrix sp. ST-888]|uniref:HNH endonuclease signature motif containing protein n=1 Tax=Saccharothrix sp. ST-888 TaxID=1427391 RepID=UPI0009E3DA5D|nr:HNH endonuclease signature motif containing protein [Saccharothrix sp. ST-888]
MSGRHGVPRRPARPAPTPSRGHGWQARFFAKIDKGSEFDACWLWRGAIDQDGYGKFRLPDKAVVGAHIISWELATGNAVPPGWHVDHLCRIRRCCNPDHLEAVEQSQNTLRGESFAAKNAVKTHCPRGHEYTPENTRWHHNSRECITCIRQRDRERRQARRDEEAWNQTRSDIQN